MSTSTKPTVFCLMGPTASGKTDLAIKLVQAFPFEIISVDSTMVYKGLDIGSAKPTADELKQAPHHLIDIIDPATPYSAADFCKDANLLIQDIVSRGKMPLLVGGTMLYFKALQDGLSDLPEADETIRSKILKEADEIGWDVLHQRLKKIDPESAARIHPNDPQRLQRALEVHELTGKSLTEHFKDSGAFQNQFQFINIALVPDDRSILHDRIAKRFALMLEAGFIDEVKSLYDRGDLNKDLPAVRAIGYRQVWSYLEKTISKEEMQERGVIATRQLAKRQLTWLRSWENIKQFNCLDSDLFIQVSTYIKDKLANVLQKND